MSAAASALERELALLSPRQRALLEVRLQQRRRGAADDRIEPQPPDPEGHPLSFSQQRLWLVEQLAPGLTDYNVANAVRMTGPLSAAALGDALAEVTRRHEALRTVIAVRGGEPVQRIAPAVAAALPLVDLGALAATDREAEARRVIGRASRRLFDLARGPLERSTLLRLAAREHVLLSIVHHIVSDWSSLRLLLRETCSLYPAFAGGRPSPLPEPALQLRDFAVWQRRRLAGERLGSHLVYWRRQLAGVPPYLDLPTDFPRGGNAVARGGCTGFELGEALTRQLAELAEREGASLFVLLLAAYQVMLHHHARRGHFVVSSPIGYRNQEEAEGIFGLLVNTLLFRADLAGDPTFRELLGRVRATVAAAYDHQHLPLERIVEQAAPERQPGRPPFLEASLNVVEQDLWEPLEVGDLSLSAIDCELGSPQFELNLLIARAGTRLTGKLHYRADLYSRATSELLARQFERAAELAASRPDLRLSELRAGLAREEGKARAAATERVAEASLDRFRTRRRRAVDGREQVAG